MMTEQMTRIMLVLMELRGHIMGMNNESKSLRRTLRRRGSQPQSNLDSGMHGVRHGDKAR